jgi:hypothetical protein
MHNYGAAQVLEAYVALHPDFLSVRISKSIRLIIVIGAVISVLGQQ